MCSTSGRYPSARVVNPVVGEVEQGLVVGVGVPVVAGDEFDDVVAVCAGEHDGAALAVDHDPEACDGVAHGHALDGVFHAVHAHRGAAVDALGQFAHVLGGV